jgi:hypothetical protein
MKSDMGTNVGVGGITVAVGVLDGRGVGVKAASVAVASIDGIEPTTGDPQASKSKAMITSRKKIFLFIRIPCSEIRLFFLENIGEVCKNSAIRVKKQFG